MDGRHRHRACRAPPRPLLAFTTIRTSTGVDCFERGWRSSGPALRQSRRCVQDDAQGWSAGCTSLRSFNAGPGSPESPTAAPRCASARRRSRRARPSPAWPAGRATPSAGGWRSACARCRPGSSSSGFRPASASRRTRPDAIDCRSAPCGHARTHSQCRCRVLAASRGASLAGAGRREDADHHVAQHHLAAVHPRAGVGPELVAVRAVRIGEDVDRARGRPSSVRSSGWTRACSTRPRSLAPRTVFQRCFGHLLTLRIQQRKGAAMTCSLSASRTGRAALARNDVAVCGPGREAAGAGKVPTMVTPCFSSACRAAGRSSAATTTHHDASDADGGGRGEGRTWVFVSFLGPEGGRLASRSATLGGHPGGCRRAGLRRREWWSGRGDPGGVEPLQAG